jgi:hypothetical protein
MPSVAAAHSAHVQTVGRNVCGRSAWASGGVAHDGSLNNQSGNTSASDGVEWWGLSHIVRVREAGRDSVLLYELNNRPMAVTSL